MTGVPRGSGRPSPSPSSSPSPSPSRRPSPSPSPSPIPESTPTSTPTATGHGPTTRDDDLARSARFWLRAYPRRWRAERGDELVALLTDLAGLDARSLDARTAADLVRSGWATRLRMRPPLGHWLAYRFVGARIRPAYRAWARDDIEGRLFPARRALVSYAFVLVMAGVDLLSPGPGIWGPGWWWLIVAIAVVGTVVSAGPERARAVERHLALDSGELVVPGAVVSSLGPDADWLRGPHSPGRPPPSPCSR